MATRDLDEIGSLAPSARTPAGHRLYDRPDVERLQQIQSLRAENIGNAGIEDVENAWGTLIPHVRDAMARGDEPAIGQSVMTIYMEQGGEARGAAGASADARDVRVDREGLEGGQVAADFNCSSPQRAQ